MLLTRFFRGTNFWIGDNDATWVATDRQIRRFLVRMMKAYNAINDYNEKLRSDSSSEGYV